MNHLILFGLAIFGLLVFSCSSPVFAIGTVNDTINIDTILSKAQTSYGDASSYELTDSDQLDLSNSDIVCPSNDCKSILKDEGALFRVPTLTINEGSSYMAMTGNLNLVDEKSNGQLGPKKQKLIEQMDIDFTCSLSDIQEDIKNNTTKYICSQPDKDNLIIERKFNDTKYIYRFTASFELPSRHLVINATEAHENLYPLIGQQVFRNETGQIEIK